MAKGAVRHDRLSSNSSTTRLRNKRRVRDISKAVVATMVFLLSVQAAASIYYSPMFTVNASSVSVHATPLCSELEVRNLIAPDLPSSIARLPQSSWTDALQNVPAVKSASITPRFPNRVDIVITERVPRLRARCNSMELLVLDGDLVPFRVAKVADEKLPLILLQHDIEAPVMGMSVGSKAQVTGIQTLLDWMKVNPEISVASISMQKKYLAFTISSSNVNVLLGTPRRLAEKLESLEILLKRRPELLTSRKYSAINLFSDEYPALVFRSTSSGNSAVR